MSKKKYTTALAKGQGLIPETMALLSAWEPTMSRSDFLSHVMETGIIPRATALRVRDLVNRVFHNRFLADYGPPALFLKKLMTRGFPSNQLSQMFLIHTARANLILHDFIRGVYWPRYSAGADSLGREDVLEFLESSVVTGQIGNRWSDTMNIKMSRYLLNSLEEFGLLNPLKKGRRTFLPFTSSVLTTLYLSHYLHFSRTGDNFLVDHPDWGLFGLGKQDVIKELERASFDGHFIVQYSGELLRIAWLYNGMEDFIDGVASAGF
jgi:hypothetical protein